MKQISELLIYLQENNGKSISQKFEDSGLLHGIEDQIIKEKILNAFELALNVFNTNDTFRERTSTYVFPIIRMMFNGKYSIANEQNDDNCFLIDSSFEFDEQKMIEFIKFVSDCSDLYNYQKYIKYIDVEAYLSLFLAKIYANEQNDIIKKLKHYA